MIRVSGVMVCRRWYVVSGEEEINEICNIDDIFLGFYVDKFRSFDMKVSSNFCVSY